LSFFYLLSCRLWRLIKFFLFLMSAETAHRFVLFFLRKQNHRLQRNRRVPQIPEVHKRSLWGQFYSNPVGLAAGFDKGEVLVPVLFELGFGFIEIGTVTPRPQEGNQRPRLFRLKEYQALINRMGFNNPGAQAVAQRLRNVPQRVGPLWLNIGKNKDTPLSAATDDYVSAMQTLYLVADAFVINVSSPNTLGLRNLQSATLLSPLLENLRAEAHSLAQKFGVAERPLLLKISPDIADDDLPDIVILAKKFNFNGIIATNTTITRPVSHHLCHEEGGFSGPALRPRSYEVLRSLRALIESDRSLTLVSVGGITSTEDIRERLTVGASLVELYTHLIYRGPESVKLLLQQLKNAKIKSA